jgi:hypothetical protein
VRSLLRFLFLCGITRALLVGAVPSPAGWSLASVPRYIGDAEVRALLEGCDHEAPGLDCID